MGQVFLVVHNSGTYNLYNANYTNPRTVAISGYSEPCNKAHDKDNNKVSFEFYLDNDLEETDATEIYDDD